MRVPAWLVAGAVIVLLGAGVLHFRKEAAKERLRADTATAQAGLNATVGSIADKASTQTRVIIQQTESAAHEVEAIPSDELDPDLRRAWVAGLRDATGEPYPDNSAEP